MAACAVRATGRSSRPSLKAMKRFFLIVVLAICLSPAVFAQDEGEDPRVTLPDVFMEQLVTRIVNWYFKPAKKPKRVYFGGNIKKEWLPKIKNIEFVIPEKSERPVFYFGDILKYSGRHRIDFGYGKACEGSIGDYWTFMVVGSRVRSLKPSGSWESTPCESGLTSKTKRVRPRDFLSYKKAA